MRGIRYKKRASSPRPSPPSDGGEGEETEENFTFFESHRVSHHAAAFTLIEVMVAIALFFMAIFAILDLVTQSMRMARSLNQMGPTAGMVAAELSLTNKLEEGTVTGDWDDLYEEYTWQQDVMIYGTNGMFQVDITVFKENNVDSSMSIFLFRPESENHMSDGNMSGGRLGDARNSSNQRNSPGSRDSSNQRNSFDRSSGNPSNQRSSGRFR